MAAPVLRSQLVIDARERANMENNQFVTDAKIERMLDQAAKKLYDKLVTARGQEYYRVTQSFNTVSGQQNYALHPSFYQLLAVRTNLDGFWRTLAPFQVQDTDKYLNAATLGLVLQPVYRLTGVQDSAADPGVVSDNIDILPVPAGIYAVQYDFIPFCNTADGTGDFTYNGINGWEEWMAICVAIQMLAKQEQDTSDLRADLAAEEARLGGLAPARDAGRPERSVDARRSSGADDWPFGRRFPGF